MIFSTFELPRALSASVRFALLAISFTSPGVIHSEFSDRMPESTSPMTDASVQRFAYISNNSFLASSSGSHTNIFASKRPARSIAGSSASMRFVVPMNSTLLFLSNPSISIRSVFKTFTSSVCPPVGASDLFHAIASISSKNTTHGSCNHSNTAFRFRWDSLCHFEVTSAKFTR